ncbi:MAG: aconitase/3-isopropylmalate dehydratase large subunit family protein [Candidatus Omnitrophota bacterium]
MEMTLTEKILAKGAKRREIRPGENIWVEADILMTHDICGPGTINIFHEKFGPDAKVWDPEKIVVIPDHFIFTQDPRAKEAIAFVRKFVKEQGIQNFYDVGVNFRGTFETLGEDYAGVCHIVLAKKGHNRPGEIIFGTDSHTCTSGAFGAFATGIGDADAALILGTGKLWVKVPPTMKFVVHGKLPPYLMAKDLILKIIGTIGVGGATYKAMEFTGEGIEGLHVEEKMTLCNMVIEAGAKNGIIPPTEDVLSYVRKRTSKPFEAFKSDPGAVYASVHEFRADEIEPGVAKPHSPGNYETARRLKDVAVNRAYIGSCTGGKLTDFQAAARILKGKKVKIETFVVPATMEVYNDLYREKLDGKTLADIFKEALVKGPMPPGCQACLGGPDDTVARATDDTVVISTTNRNFIGRMGSKKAQVYLASPYTAAASAVTGYITDPREFL